MFKLWDVAIAPVLAAGRARRVVEIGALHGDMTRRMLDFLGPDAELHVIDPAPNFDPAEHEAAFAGHYHFHHDLSLNVLPTLPAVDAALVDGDHNWYTVHGELTLLAEAARTAGQPLPLLLLHDVGWPYGRRDLYYEPDRVPEEFRQPWARAGMREGEPGLLRTGGVNPTMCNAVREGGPRNGVMTALEDFLAEHDRPARLVVLPLFFGLAIVADEDRLAQEPALHAALDHLESDAGRHDLLAVGESIRLRALGNLHGSLQRDAATLARANRRYLDLLKGALLDEHYLENEIRLRYLARCAYNGEKPEADRVRDPVRAQPDVYNQLLQRRRDGSAAHDEAANGFLPYATLGRTRLDHLERSLDTVFGEGVPGDIVECATGRGGAAIFMRGYLAAHEVTDRLVWISDPFRASPAPARVSDVVDESMSELQADLNLAREAFERFDLLDDQLRFLQGTVPETLPDAAFTQVALLRLGTGIGADAGAALEAVYPRMPVGAVVVVDDHRDPACADAVAAFRDRHGITTPLDSVDFSAVTWRKAEALPSEGGRPQPVQPVTLSLPLAPPAPVDAIDLTIVVVFHNMRREAERTLYSLSRAYQQGIDDVAYEVIAVENGSAPDQRLGREMVEAFGPEFRYLDLGEEARPSPSHALNRGIQLGRGTAFALMIDGAHVLTPGVLRFGLAGLSTYAPAIVATQQWYVGPGQQGDAMSAGYDQAYEDRLFKRIGWPSDGYRLFEISHFVGGRDWLDGVWESNCMFVSRRQLEQVGGFDERFAMAGGGYANLELYERLGSSPDVTVSSILGEASFHQLHGGVTTNQPDADERRSRVFGYGEHFADLKGRRFRGPGKPIHYVGRISSHHARRSRPRRLTARAFDDIAEVVLPDGLPASPLPVPEDLRLSFIEAVWNSRPWDHSDWLGRAHQSAPTDLLAYQQLITSVRPDWVIETGPGEGGRTLFLAGVCELADQGKVISIGEHLAEDLPIHPRITYVDGPPTAPVTVERVKGIVGPEPRALLLLGGRLSRQETEAQFEAYAPLVPVGSHVIVADTLVNGNPVWTAFGAGPFEAVRQILARHGEFAIDPEPERYSLTFNPGGFLKRVR
jgi:cephalosporin hydroxylase